MKKIVYLLTLFVGTLLLTGCGSNIKTLKCTEEKKVNGQFGSQITEETITFNTKTAEFEKIHYKLTVDLTDETAIEEAKKQKAMETLKSGLEDVCEEALKNGADKCTVTTPREYAIVIDSEGDVSTGAIDQKVANMGTLEEMKAYFEGLNYTCKEE